MGKINILTPNIFNRIAAGEVVDRPYSVVKELVENAIDAGATEIEVRIEKGGKSYISVTDNGEGIDHTDLKSVFLPHATSKISSADDLERIKTLGFRGEAVASIASVSHMKYTSRQEGKSCYSIECNGGETGEIMQVADGEVGTIVEVNDLFFNTPVRLKFLKTDKGEEADISTFVNRFILSHPEICFKYYADNRLMAQSFGGGDEEVLVSVYGSNILYNTYHIAGQRHGIKIRGYISNQNYFKANKSAQSIFLNGRFIVNSTLQAAITNAYSKYVMKRQYPFYVLHIDMPMELVDVNVHPNKADVRFADNQVVYSALYGVVAAVLDGSVDGMNYLVPSTPLFAEAKKVEPKVESKSIFTEETVKEPVMPSYIPEWNKPTASQAQEEKRKPVVAEIPEIKTEELPFPDVEAEAKRKAEIKERARLFAEAVKEIEDRRDPHYDFEDVREELRQAELEKWREKHTKKGRTDTRFQQQYADLFFPDGENAFDVSKKPVTDVFAENKRLLEEMEGKAKQTKINVDSCEYKGNLFNTYLIYELGDDAYIIDQHAAHERLIFNRLQEKIKNRTVVQQPLLLPQEIHITPQEDAFLYDCLPLLHEIGFDIVESGIDRFTIKAVPLDLMNFSINDFFGQFLRDMSGLQKIKLEDLLRDKLAMMACKAAVKGGMELTKEEVKQLLEDMDGDTSLKCPHGRPAVVKMSKYEIEKMFKRIV